MPVERTAIVLDAPQDGTVLVRDCRDEIRIPVDAILGLVEGERVDTEHMIPATPGHREERAGKPPKGQDNTDRHGQAQTPEAPAGAAREPGQCAVCGKPTGRALNARYCEPCAHTLQLKRQADWWARKQQARKSAAGGAAENGRIAREAMRRVRAAKAAKAAAKSAPIGSAAEAKPTAPAAGPQPMVLHAGCELSAELSVAFARFLADFQTLHARGRAVLAAIGEGGN